MNKSLGSRIYLKLIGENNVLLPRIMFLLLILSLETL